MDIRRQVAYAENARRLLRETLDTHPETVLKPIGTSGPYRTIGQLVAHLIGAEQRLTLKRLYAEDCPSQYEEHAAETVAELFADWDVIRARTLAFAASADSIALGRVIVMEMPKWGRTAQLTAEEFLLHICNHQTWHLGQVSMALQQFGIDPPYFDYILLKADAAP